MPNLPTGTVTLFFADMEGSTRLLQQLGERYADVLAEFRRLLRQVFVQCNGYEVDTQGDAFFVVFDRAIDAISTAAAIQRTLFNHSWSEDVTVRVRIGLHTGEPILTSDGYIGMDVHHTARIMSAAHGGQILLSQTNRSPVDGSYRFAGRNASKHPFPLNWTKRPARRIQERSFSHVR